MPELDIHNESDWRALYRAARLAAQRAPRKPPPAPTPTPGPASSEYGGDDAAPPGQLTQLWEAAFSRLANETAAQEARALALPRPSRGRLCLISPPRPPPTSPDPGRRCGVPRLPTRARRPRRARRATAP